MSTHTSATAREEAPHETETTATPISDALRRHAELVINDTSIDPQWRTIIRYALELNDPGIADLLGRAMADEDIVDTFESLQTPDEDAGDSTGKIDTLADIICRSGEDSTAALFVMMGTIAESVDVKHLANHVKHLAFSRCAEQNLYGLVDAQVAVIEGELLAGDRLVS